MKEIKAKKEADEKAKMIEEEKVEVQTTTATKTLGQALVKKGFIEDVQSPGLSPEEQAEAKLVEEIKESLP